jgi:CubicO group peptidase (beta-lactamase class C family)
MIDNTAGTGRIRRPAPGKATIMPTSISTRRDVTMKAAAGPGGAVRWMLVAVASLLVVCVIASPAAAATPPDRATLARMDGVIREGMERSGMPGFAVAVVSGNDVVFARGYGDAGEGRRVTPQTPFLLGSTSKSFTALAAMQLVDAGRLDLNAPARQYVPEFRLADQRAADRITVRQVFQQTTGLPRTAGGPVVRSAVDGTALRPCRSCRGRRWPRDPGPRLSTPTAITSWPG